jgi:2,4-dienoyl-CoA reductase-like NADH-dependent reductase (Old Yellow Enzyme family)
MKSLFDRTQLGRMKMKNRFIRGATNDRFAVDSRPTEKDIQVYEELAKGGVGTIITGLCCVSGEKISPGIFGMDRDSLIEDYRRLTDRVHSFGANIVLQLVRCGSLAHDVPPEVRLPGPSAVQNQRSGYTPFEMTRQDILAMENEFAAAAVRAKKAGFDGVGVPAAPRFVGHHVRPPAGNRRPGACGGGGAPRARILAETYRAVREAVGSGYPIWVKLNCNDSYEGGITREGFLTAGRLAMEAGIDAVEVSGVWNGRKKDEAFYFLDCTRELAESSRTPVILIGGNRNFDAMTRVLNETPLSFFGICRPLITEPGLVNRWAGGDTGESGCVYCDGCIHSKKERRCVLAR